MPALHIKDVPTEVVEALRKRAVQHERSLEEELRQLLCEAAVANLPKSRSLDLTMSPTRYSGPWRREEMYRDEGR